MSVWICSLHGAASSRSSASILADVLDDLHELGQLVALAAGEDHEFPGLLDDGAWSPDGQQIAFVRWPGGSADLYVMNSDGSGQRRLTNTPGYGEITYAWSNAGTR